MFGHLIAAYRVGATVRRLLWLAFWGGRAVGYAEARETGVSEREAIEAVTSGIVLPDYNKARKVATHREILQAYATTGDIFGYACYRTLGDGHQAAINAVGEGLLG
ncbi:hypothetical protein [Actinomadura montaniterrae]|uniref:Uncharacterized protein n=1 Tax=Actinomadura montaniterrae TaxID=1803903 RepID=A0A6L3VZM2_9ACTN|nr:hypothetical protein [Actinomadura montaniterrae]KAB2385942.1 hypothetical protein F9B16_09070 [Actinomadura montaniterrae]